MSLVLCVAAPARGAEFQGHARLWTGPGFDSNAKREFVSSDVGTQPDGFIFALLQLDGALRVADIFTVLGAYDGAARKFFVAPTEDTIVQSGLLETSVRLGKLFAVGLQGRVRDRRGADRDYTDLQGGVLVDFFPDAAFDLRAFINAHRFLFYNRFAYSHWGPDGGFQARYRFTRRHSILLNASFNARTYNSDARPAPREEGDAPPPVRRRSDAVWSVGAAYQYRGPFHFTFSYAYYDQTSNSFGETVQRHRLSATGGFRLPWSIMVMASITWQPSLFADGVYLSPDLTVVEDDENMSNATLKVVRPITKWLDVDVRYAFYLGIYPQNDFLYLRHVASVGLSASF